MADIHGYDYAENAKVADEFFEMYLLSDEEEDKNFASVLVDIPDFDAEGKRALNFSIVGPEFDEFLQRSPQRMRLRVGEMDGRKMRAYVTDRQVLAIGTYLWFLEIHGIDEMTAWELMDESVPDEWLNEYVEYVDGLSEPDRGREMMKQVERKMEAIKQHGSDTNPFWDRALKEGEWRSKGLSNEEQEVARKIADSVDIDPRSCHYTAANAIKQVWNDDRVEYCEGLAFSKSLGRTTRHAWIEVNERVVELTWPWHRVDGAEGMYYGIPVPREVVEERLNDRGHGAELLLNENEYSEMVRQRQNV